MEGCSAQHHRRDGPTSSLLGHGNQHSTPPPILVITPAPTAHCKLTRKWAARNCQAMVPSCLKRSILRMDGIILPLQLGLVVRLRHAVR